MIAIIDYGLGNIKAFYNLYKTLNIPITIATRTEHLTNVTKIILPGVGAFDHAMTRLEESGMKQTLDEMVLEKNIPVLGICVGMQILAHSSEEGSLAGLGWVEGKVKRFDSSALIHHTHLPHMGWNDVQPVVDNYLFNELANSSRFYFLHSYYFYCNSDDTIAVTDYGGTFTSAINNKNIFGVQFHPEKSHKQGVQLLKNFANF